MKTLTSLALVAGLAFITANVSAQNADKATPDPQNMAEKMTAAVKQTVAEITPDEESKILAVEKTFAQGMIDARNSSNGDRDAMRSKMGPLKDTRDAQIKTILTANQYAQYQKAEAAHAAKRAAGN